MFAKRLLLAAFLTTLLLNTESTLAAPIADGPQAHMVFFTLAEPSDSNRDKLIAACHKYLADHDGVVYFSVGARAKNLSRAVNDDTFDVALHVVFVSPADHTTYQTHPRHLAFIKEAKSLWSSVRVFDSNLVAPTASSDASIDQAAAADQ